MKASRQRWIGNRKVWLKSSKSTEIPPKFVHAKPHRFFFSATSYQTQTNREGRCACLLRVYIYYSIIKTKRVGRAPKANKKEKGEKGNRGGGAATRLDNYSEKRNEMSIHVLCMYVCATKASTINLCGLYRPIFACICIRIFLADSFCTSLLFNHVVACLWFHFARFVILFHWGAIVCQRTTDISRSLFLFLLIVHFITLITFRSKSYHFRKGCHYTQWYQMIDIIRTASSRQHHTHPSFR